MRLQIMCSLVLLGTVLTGQRSLPVTWKTKDGTIGTAYLKKMPFQLKEEEQLVFYQQQDRDSIITLPDQLDWVIYQGDTLLTRHVHNDYPKLMRLLYQGDIRLYKVIQDWAYEQYYLVKGDQWELLSHLKAKEAGYRILRQNCHQFKPIDKIRNEYQAIEVARQINHCIGEAKHYPMPQFKNYQHQLGVAYNIPGKLYSRFDDRRNRATFKSSRYYWPIYIPAVSLFYQRQIFRNRPWLKTQLNVFFLHSNHQQNSTLVSPNTNIQARESLEFTALYFYPGLNFATSPKRRVQFSIGGGTVIAAPIASRRTITLQGPVTVPDKPVIQEFTNFVDTRLGYYLQSGIQLGINQHIHLAFNFRIESLSQNWHFYEKNSDDILYSNAFPNRYFLAQPTSYRLQLQAAYSW